MQGTHRKEIVKLPDSSSILPIFANEPEASPPANPGATIDPEFPIDIIWHNIYIDSTFSVFRKKSRTPLPQLFVGFARIADMGFFEQIISVNASSSLFCITVACTHNWEGELKAAILSMM